MVDEPEFCAGHKYHNIATSGHARAHFGDSYNSYHTYTFPQYSEFSKEERIVRTVLKGLMFEGLGKRSRELSEAHREAFDWVLNSRTPERPKFVRLISDYGKQEWWRPQDERRETSHHLLRDWLTEDCEALLWVTGKPGSGKSTLLKAVQEHKSFDVLSRQWTGQAETFVVVADHYFWIAGTPEQRSLAGMFRALLHGIISTLSLVQKNDPPTLSSDQYSKMLELICGTRWSSGSSNQHWSCYEAQQALLRACSCNLKLVFFVDGLDECNLEDHSTLIKTIIELSAFQNVKLLISSRPRPVFAQKLEHLPHLRLEELTFFDMCEHVQGQLVEAESLKEVKSIATSVTNIIRP